jgi:hypothetical protein
MKVMFCDVVPIGEIKEIVYRELGENGNKKLQEEEIKDEIVKRVVKLLGLIKNLVNSDKFLMIEDGVGIEITDDDDYYMVICKSKEMEREIRNVFDTLGDREIEYVIDINGALFVVDKYRCIHCDLSDVVWAVFDGFKDICDALVMLSCVKYVNLIKVPGETYGY